MAGSVAAGGTSSNSPVTLAQAKSHLLTATDMPKGWSIEPGTTKTQNASYPAGSSYIACLGAAGGLQAALPPETDTPYFENKSGSQEIQDSISGFASAAGARASFDALANPRFAGCATGLLNHAMQTSAPKGATIGAVSVSPPLGPRFGPQTSGYVVEVPITTEGSKLLLIATSVFFVKGDLGQELIFNDYAPTGGGGAFPPAVIKRMVAVAKGRL